MKLHVNVRCNWCDKLFTILGVIYIHQRKIKRSGGVCCSLKCAGFQRGEFSYPKHLRPVKVPRPLPVVFPCDNCETSVVCPRWLYRVRKRDSKSGLLFCSNSCSALMIKRTGVPPKRKPGMSEEQYQWELLLNKEGLGVYRGGSNLYYGHEDEVPKERMRTIMDRRGK